MPNPLYTYILNIYDLVWLGFMAYQPLLFIYMIWFGWVLRHINHCRLFILFGLVWFYGISTIVGYLMPNPLYTYILNI